MEPTVYRPSRGKGKGKSRLWWGMYSDPATGEKKRVPLKVAGKGIAQRLVTERYREAVANMGNRFGEHESRPLEEHVSEYESHLRFKENSPDSIRTTMQRVRDIVEGCRFAFWSDISAMRVEHFITGLRDNGLSIQTCNYYLGAFKTFCRWLVRDGRAGANPVEHLSGGNAKTDRRLNRRAFLPDELYWLLAETGRSNKTCYGMTGPVRALFYQLAVESGLRRGELRGLFWGDFDLTGDPPTVTVRAAYAKNGRDDTLPMKPATAQL